MNLGVTGFHIANDGLVKISQNEIECYQHVQHLIMDWGLRPCWVPTTVRAGLRFTKRFQGLVSVHLLVYLDDAVQKGDNIYDTLGRIFDIVVRERASESLIFPEWNPPYFHVVESRAFLSRLGVDQRRVGEIHPAFDRILEK